MLAGFEAITHPKTPLRGQKPAAFEVGVTAHQNR
jgi:hypothetical protein